MSGSINQDRQDKMRTMGALGGKEEKSECTSGTF